MLETLDTIDWAKLRHSHGTAEKFPVWIRELRSDDPDTRQGAFEELSEYSNHQGSIYEATPYIVPFMIELLSAPDTQEKDSILHLLAGLASGSRGLARIGQYGGDEKATHKNISAGLDIYLAQLDDPSPDVRFAAFRLITEMPHAAQLWTTVQRLIDAASRETDAGTLVEMIPLLHTFARTSPFWGNSAGLPGQIGEQIEALMGFLASLLAPERPARVRFRAALAHLAMAGESQQGTADVIVGVLQDVLVNPESYSEETSDFRIEWEMNQAVEGLEILPRPRRLSILVEALGAACYAGDAHLIGWALLETVFFGAPRPYKPGQFWAQYHQPHAFLARTQLPPDASAERPDQSGVPFRQSAFPMGPGMQRPGRRYITSAPPADLKLLSAEDRRLLRLVLDTDLVWMVHSNLLEVYGLPVHRDDARALLDEADAANAGGTAP